MKRKWIWRVLFLYGLILLGCMVIIFWNTRAYHQVTVIESREESARRADISLPIRIEFQDAYLGQGVIDQEERLQRIDELSQKLLREGTSKRIPADEQNVPRMIGHIVYLNGKTQDFALGNQLWLSGMEYDDANGNVQNMLHVVLEGLVTPQHLVALLPEAAEVHWFSSRDDNRILTSEERRQLSAALQEARPLGKDDAHLQLEVRQMVPSAHIRIYLHKSVKPNVHLRDDILNIDIYENGCLALQYLGDTSGRSLWAAAKVCRQWSGGASL